MGRVISFTDQGLVRKKNEDTLWVDLDRGLFLVADGMGGYDGGEVASQLAVEVMVRCLSPLVDEGESVSWSRALLEACLEANQLIFEQAQSTQELSGMGTTLTGALIKDNRLYIAHVGDSRAYLWRLGKLLQLTEDHSLVGEMVRSGGISEEEALHHPQRNVITRALGTQEQVMVDLIEEEWLPGDRLILCTDGVTNLVSNLEIVEILEGGGWDNSSGQALLNLALDRGGNDNLTLIAVSEREEVRDSHDR